MKIRKNNNIHVEKYECKKCKRICKLNINMKNNIYICVYIYISICI